MTTTLREQIMGDFRTSRDRADLHYYDNHTV